jgi:hypothetical protein
LVCRYAEQDNKIFVEQQAVRAAGGCADGDWRCVFDKED